MRCFTNIAKLIRSRRINHPKGYSQSELSSLLGYKNGQFISNVERALCNIPLRMLGRVSEVLDIRPEEIKSAMASDLDKTLDNYFTYSQTKRVIEEVPRSSSSTESVEPAPEVGVVPDWKRTG
jgi:transcriptional regulator with XRE-family HTH domain